MFFVQSNAYSVDYTLPVSELPSLDLGEAPDETPGAAFINTTGDGGEDWISMTDARSFEAMIPVEMSETEAEATISAADFKWTLSRTDPYLSTELFPNFNTGGDLTGWEDNGENDLFQNIQTSVYKVDEDTVCLKLKLDCVSYYADGSIPHGYATLTMDYIGWYSLAAVYGEDPLGSVTVKIVPYDHFRTMGEVYDEISALASYNSDYYVEECSMGKSQCGYDMPYLIIAKDETAVDHWLELCERAETEPDKVLEELDAGTLEDYQVPVMFSNIHSNETAATDSILNFAWMLLKNETIDYDMLTDFTETGESQLSIEMGTPGEKGSLAVPDLIKDAATYLGYLKAGNKASGSVDLSKYYEVDTNTVDVDDLLDDVFFILVPEENVEGRIYMSRISSGGLDLNRDNSFQTQNETQNMQKLIGQFNPVSLTELHGRVKAFQCEPCDPPHEPNFEYDLLARNLMTGGEAFGIAAIANNDLYNSYVIPQRDYLQYTGETVNDSYETYWADPWDDMSTSYTPQFAMLHGCVGYTVELPAYNNETVKAAAYGQLGQSVYVAENKDKYLEAQLEIFERGVNNANSNSYDLVGQWFCDQYDVEGAEADLFRPEFDNDAENGNFYPECYIIPLDRTHQSNLQAAYDMMEWLSRNDVKILLTDQAFTYEGITYPAGTMIITMYQAKRSVANSALYDGTLIKDWTVLYSEGITTFNETRGFDMATCARPDDYNTIRAACGEALDYEDCLEYLEKATSSLSGNRTGYQVIISNSSEDSTAAVNELLQQGKTVGMIMEGNYRGDYICSYSDWLTVCDDFILTGTCISRNYPAAKIITKSPTIYINGTPGDSTYGYINYGRINAYSYNYDRQAMDLMNFKMTTDLSEADIIIGCSALDAEALSSVQSGTPYIGYGSGATAPLRGQPDSGLNYFFDGIDRNSVYRSMDALAYVTYPEENMINASYILDDDDVMYGYGAGYFSSVPESAEILVRIDGDREPTEGFLRAYDDKVETNLDAFLDASIQSFSYQGKDKGGNDINTAFFANSLTHKVHQRDEYAFISNFAFSNMLGGEYSAKEYHSGSGSGSGSSTTPEETTTPAAAAPELFSDISGHWAKNSIEYVVGRKLFSGVSKTHFAPNETMTRGMLVTVLGRAYGLDPESYGQKQVFTDVPLSAYYAPYVAWAYENKIVSGMGEGLFAPDKPVSRGEMAAIITNYMKFIGKGSAGITELNYADTGGIADWGLEGVRFVTGNGLMSGTGDNRFDFDGLSTRAQVATVMERLLKLIGE
jgi:hypothetical protein